VEVDPYLIDINIHPTKMDIKFSEFAGLKELINNTIKKQLENLTLIPSIKPVTRDKLNVENNSSFKDIVDNYIETETPSIKEDYTMYNNIEEIALNFDADKEKSDIELPFDEEKKTRIKKMYPVGLVHGTYIIAENEDGMYLIDQHAANERINYEKYLKSMGTHDNKMIDLLIPIKIELSNSDYIILKQHFKLLSELHFEIEEFGINTIIVRSCPYWLPENNLEETIRKIFEIIIMNESFDSYKFTEKVAITLACKMSIKANDHISLEQMEYLLDTLRETDNPFTCPHGRPTIISYSKYELEKLFKRAMN